MSKQHKARKSYEYDLDEEDYEKEEWTAGDAARWRQIGTDVLDSDYDDDPAS